LTYEKNDHQVAQHYRFFFVLFAALIAVVRFYPYTYNFPAYPKITHTQSGAAGDPINMLFVGVIY